MTTVRVPFTPPLAWSLLLAFFRARAIAGVEVVDDTVESGAYRRTFVGVDGATGVVRVRCDVDASALMIDVTPRLAPSLPAIAAGVRRMFDVDADPAAIVARLGRDRALAASFRAHPGLRVAGAFDPWEVCARAVVGQQVSVPAATTIMGRLVARFGAPLVDGSLSSPSTSQSSSLALLPSSPASLPSSSSSASSKNQQGADGARLAPTHAFPTASRIAEAECDGIGMPGARVRTLRAMAVAVRDGAIVFDASRTHDETRAALLAMPGIGPWTAEYVCMRTRGDADAFPAGDLVLRQRLAVDGALPSAKEVSTRAERWRPFRAYAAIALWSRPLLADAMASGKQAARASPKPARTLTAAPTQVKPSRPRRPE